MKIHDNPPQHLAYCLNVHPGRTWAESFEAIRTHALRVRDEVCGSGKSFGLGLRLGRDSADQLVTPGTMTQFKSFLDDQNLYVFTINGFPYGEFHGRAVKEDAYRPDWRMRERLEYTNLLADILADLLPEGVSGSISTVPGSYKPWITCAEDVDTIAEMLAEAAGYLAGIHSRTGKDICLAIEPEPDCLIETTDELLTFFGGALAEIGGAHLAGLDGISEAEAARILQRHIGICFDTSHQAVEFEDLSSSLGRLRAAGVRIGKVQLSSALRLIPTQEALSQLGSFVDEVYLHQVKVCSAGGPRRSFSDLDEAIKRCAKADEVGDEWRVHFHVPLFLEQFGELQSTSSLLMGDFAEAIGGGAIEHLEIETYTFDCLPDGVCTKDVAESIVREYRWVLDSLLPQQLC